MASAPPYLALFYAKIMHFSSDQIGVLLAIAPFVQSVACPFWTHVVDKRPQWHAPLMGTLCIIGGAAILFVMYLGKQTEEKSKWTLEVSMLWLTSACVFCYAFCSGTLVSLVDSAVMKILGPNKIMYGEQRLWGSISAGLTVFFTGQIVAMWNNDLYAIFIVFGLSSILFILLAFSTAIDDPEGYARSEYSDESDSVSPLLCPTTTNPKNEKTYGTSSSYQRLLLPAEGSSPPANINLSLNLPQSGYFDDLLQNLSKSMSYASISSLAKTVREEADDYIEETRTLTMGLALSRLPSMEASMAGILPYPQQEVEAPSAEMIWNRRIVSFLTTVFLYGVTLAMINQFLFLFLSKDLGVASSWLGLTGPASAIMELIMFLFCKQLTERFGVTKLVVVAHLVTMIRSIAYTFLVPNLMFTNFIALILQFFNGIGFALFWATAVSEVDNYFPPTQRSVAQGILAGLYGGLGTGFGCFFWRLPFRKLWWSSALPVCRYHFCCWNCGFPDWTQGMSMISR
ncbi:hypothetical protein NQZ79_g1822 [Umbelopsis isabellina]|nr:hypothetical protein NQZ79_g1822 [Umbelopsis isabellina]